MHYISLENLNDILGCFLMSFFIIHEKFFSFFCFKFGIDFYGFFEFAIISFLAFFHVSNAPRNTCKPAKSEAS